jgi:hypothetical protein
MAKLITLKHLNDGHIEDIIEALHRYGASDTAYFVEIQVDAVLSKQNVDERLKKEGLI